MMNGAAEARRADPTLSLTLRPQRAGTSQQQIKSELRERLRNVAGVRIKVVTNEASYTLVLLGEDGELLPRYAAEVERELRGLARIGQVSSSAGLQQPILRARPTWASVPRPSPRHCAWRP